MSFFLFLSTALASCKNSINIVTEIKEFTKSFLLGLLMKRGVITPAVNHATEAFVRKSL